MQLAFRNSTINYSVYGEGPAVVLLHGFLENSSMWNPFLEGLSATHQLITIDLPGHGQSGVIDTVHSMELMAESVIAVLNHLNIQQVTFVGHSMGGYVLLALAEAQPELFEQLILLNSTPFADSPQRLENRKQALKLLRTMPERFVSMAISNLFAPANRERLEAAIDGLKKDALAMPLSGITAAIKGMMQRPDRDRVLNSLGTKVVLIASEQDPLIAASELETLAKANSNHFKLLPGGHMSTYEHPILTFETLQNCL